MSARCQFSKPRPLRCSAFRDLVSASRGLAAISSGQKAGDRETGNSYPRSLFLTNTAKTTRVRRNRLNAEESRGFRVPHRLLMLVGNPHRGKARVHEVACFGGIGAVLCLNREIRSPDCLNMDLCRVVAPLIVKTGTQKSLQRRLN